jgi:hypothetical protein
MTSYKVTYTIDVDAESALAAALEVEEYLKNPSSRPYLTVSSTETVDIDLEELD